MSPAFFDLLTRLHSTELRALTMPERMNAAARHFYDYLDELGIEQCNFGGFSVNNDVGHGEAFSFTRLSFAFQEEFVQELVADDYPVLKARELSPIRPVAVLDVGMSNIDQIRAYHARSERVVHAVWREGLGDAIAIIGFLPRSSSSGTHYFGFIFGGPKGTSDLIKGRLKELETASMAMLETAQCHVEGTLEGFRYDLTDRERDLLGGLALGHHRKELAFARNISLPTVDFHLTNMRRKLGASTHAEAIAKAYRYGVLQ